MEAERAPWIRMRDSSPGKSRIKINQQTGMGENMPMRFYRVVDLGPDTTSDEPKVVITSPTNNIASTGELTVTVAATTDQPVLTGTKL